MIRLLALLLVLPLAGCIYAPRGIEGVPSAEQWVALPLRGWLAEGRGRPEAIVACLSADCPHRLAVGLITLSGEDARAAAAVLRDPEPLAGHLREQDRADRDPRRAAIRTEVAVRSIGEGRLPGFALALSRAGGGRATAHAAALGRLEGETLQVVLAVGDDAAATEAAARQAAAARFKS